MVVLEYFNDFLRRLHDLQGENLEIDVRHAGGKHLYTRSFVSLSFTPRGPCEGFAALNCSCPHGVIGGSPLLNDAKS